MPETAVMDMPFDEGPAETAWPPTKKAASTRQPRVACATGWTAGQAGHDWMRTVLVTEETQSTPTRRRPASDPFVKTETHLASPERTVMEDIRSSGQRALRVPTPSANGSAYRRPPVPSFPQASDHLGFRATPQGLLAG